MDSEQAQKEMQVPFAKYTKRVVLKDIVGRSDGGVGLIGQRVIVGGWVKSSREIKKDLPPSSPSPQSTPPEVVGHKDTRCVEIFSSVPFFKSIIKVLGGGDHRSGGKLGLVTPKKVKPPPPTTSILQISDGSCIPSLQVSVDSNLALPSLVMPTGACILAEGILQQPSIQGKQNIELKVEKVLHVGAVDQDKYPLSKKRVPLEMLRDRPHFRPRTTTVASVTRLNSALTQASHVFSQNHGFIFVQVPIITCMNTEGFDKLFQVTTLFNSQEMRGQNPADNVAGVSLETIRASLKEKSNQVDELTRSESNKEAAAAAIQDLKKTTELVAQLEAREKAKSSHSSKAKKINFSEDFFSRPAYLTVSGRLHLESYACALGNVYSLGPRFRADPSQSKRSLAEMWMLEIEMAFSELEDAMNCAGDFLKFMCKWILDNCDDDLKFVIKRIDRAVADRLNLVVSGSLEKISYADAVEVLKKATQKKFEVKVEYGVSLTEEHESYLADVVYERPVIVYNQPKELKPFNVRLNDDGKTVSSFDIILPKVGAVIRGSQNEKCLNVLSNRMKEIGLTNQECEWYLDIRRHGTARTSGFSVALDTLVLYATGLNDIKDAVPFPRSYGKAYD